MEPYSSETSFSMKPNEDEDCITPPHAAVSSVGRVVPVIWQGDAALDLHRGVHGPSASGLTQGRAHSTRIIGRRNGCLMAEDPFAEIPKPAGKRSGGTIALSQQGTLLAGQASRRPRRGW